MEQEGEKYLDTETNKPCRLLRIPWADEVRAKHETLRIVYEDNKSIDVRPEAIGTRFVKESN